jgi:hypothetical protein
VSTVTTSAWASEDWQLETNADLKPTHLVIQLRRRAHVFPWMRFVYAEGDDGLVKIAFATHMVSVSGQGLSALLAALAAHQVVRIMQPTENEAKFGVRGQHAGSYTGPAVTEITIVLNK